MDVVNEFIADIRRITKAITLAFRRIATAISQAIASAIKFVANAYSGLRTAILILFLRSTKFVVATYQIYLLLIGFLFATYVAKYFAGYVGVVFCVLLGLTILAYAFVLRAKVSYDEIDEFDIRKWDYIAHLGPVKIGFNIILTLAVTLSAYTFRDAVPQPPHIRFLVRHASFLQSPGNLETSCDNNEMWACGKLGQLLYSGDGATMDRPRAARFLKQACDGEQSDGCFFLGLATSHGHGIPRDTAKAAKLFDQACNLGEPAGCHNLAVVYGKGIGVPQDIARSLQLYTKACSQGNKSSCEILELLK